MKVRGTISQVTVTGEISQVIVRGRIEQMVVKGEIAETGVTHDPPVLVSAVVGDLDGNTLVLTYDRNIDPYSLPLAADFSFNFSGGPVPITMEESISIPSDAGVNKAVYIALSRVIAKGETGTFTYTGTAIRSEADNEGIAAALTNEAITNNVN